MQRISWAIAHVFAWAVLVVSAVGGWCFGALPWLERKSAIWTARGMGRDVGSLLARLPERVR